MPSGDLTAPTVLSVSPEDGAEDVERDPVISVEFSELVEPTRVPAALRVTGPDGQIPGQFSLSDAIVTFTPDRPLTLLGEYEITLETTLSDLAGNRLESPLRSTFRVRDGTWSTPENPFGEEDFRSVRLCAGNRAGDLLVTGNDDASPPKAWAAAFDAQTGEWTDAEPIASHETLTAYVRGLALAESGAASIAWWLGSAGSPGGWHTFTSGGFADLGPLTNTFAQLTAINRNDVAMLVTQNESRFVYTALYETKTMAPPTVGERGDLDETLHALLGVGEDFVLVTSRGVEDGQYVLSTVRHQRGTGFQEPEEVSTSAAEPLGVLADSDELGNIVIVWRHATELWARAYDAEAAEWLEPEQIAEGTSVRWNAVDSATGRVVASYLSNGVLTLAYYEPKRGWDEEDRVEAGPAEGGAVAIDTRGNAIALWSGAGDYRRYVAGKGWQPAESLQLTVAASSVGVFATSSGELAVVASDRGTEMENPVVVNFR
jgi:hypothetical protein